MEQSIMLEKKRVLSPERLRHGSKHRLTAATRAKHTY
jgi:hypothetical protein